MWPTRWSYGKVLFFTTRYFSLLFMCFVVAVMFWPKLSEELCISWIRAHWVGGTIIAVLTELTMQLRIYAMYGKSRKILALLSVTFLSVFITAFTIIVNIMKHETATTNPTFGLLPIQFCVPVGLPSYYTMFWIPLLAFELLLLVLALYKGYECSKTYKLDLLDGGSGRLAMLLVRDSILYFTVVFASFLMNELVWVIGGSNFIEIPIGFAITMGSVMSQRLLFRLRERYGDHARETSTNSHFISSRYGPPISYTTGSTTLQITVSKDIELSTFR